MLGRSLLKTTLPVFILLATTFTVSTTYLRSGVVCIEGGTVLGFPAPIFVQCNGAPLPGGGQGIDPAQFRADGLIIDLVFWYVVSLVLWMGGLRALAWFQRRGRSQDQGS